MNDNHCKQLSIRRHPVNCGYRSRHMSRCFVIANKASAAIVSRIRTIVYHVLLSFLFGRSSLCSCRNRDRKEVLKIGKNIAIYFKHTLHISTMINNSFEKLHIFNSIFKFILLLNVSFNWLRQDINYFCFVTS